MTKLINDARHVVAEMLEGLVALAPDQALLGDETVVIRAAIPPAAERPVAIISGGGSGHEPAHAGYVGAGLLSAAVAGDVFTSPSTDAVLAAIRAVAGPKGAILVVKNYTGDRLNFALAAELAQHEGIPTEIVVVADDVALRDVVAPERRRGIAGTVLIHKIAGAAAAAGHSLSDVAATAREAAAALGSMGVALGACTVPAAGKPGFTLEDDEIELGLGIHGEKGVERSAMRPADELVDIVLNAILSDRAQKSGDQVALLINGLGGTPPMELAIVARHALATLRKRGLTVARAWCGNFLTALEMPGFSLSLLPVDAARLALLDTPAHAPAWPGPGHIPAAARRVAAQPAPADAAASVSPGPLAGPLAGVLRQAAFAVADALEAAEERLTTLDAQAGDGDLGASMARGAAAMRTVPEAAWATPETALHALANALRRAIAGSSGPFYATALLRAARRLAGLPQPDAAAWQAAFADAIAAISEIGGAKPGDRTMIDALQPAADAWAKAAGQKAPQAWALAVAAAEQGVAATAAMTPRLGRASYLGDRTRGIPDGGAVAVTIWMKALTPFVR
jgi:ATP-dependent dihydroxyacetone kinase